MERFPDDWRTLDQLDRLRIETPFGQVPLENMTGRLREERTTVRISIRTPVRKATIWPITYPFPFYLVMNKNSYKKLPPDIKAANDAAQQGDAAGEGE